MDFAVSVINLVKYLKENRESIISDQIGRSGTSVGANICEAQYPTEKRILLQNFKQHLRKRMERGSGWNCFIKQITSPKRNTKRSIPLARLISAINTAKENSNGKQ